MPGNSSSEAFDPVAKGYDQAFSYTLIGQAQRQRVWALFQSLNTTPGKALEVNGGSGTDAVWLTKMGWQVYYSDVSDHMVRVARERFEAEGLVSDITSARVDAGQLADDLKQAGWDGMNFDLVFSNFGGLNCLSPAQLVGFLNHIREVLPPGGKLAMVVMGRFCWWETVYFLLKGKWRQAFRRWNGGPVVAHLDGVSEVTTWYYSHQEILRLSGMQKNRLAGVGCWLPPSYLEPQVKKFPFLIPFLKRMELLISIPGWSDHYLLVLEKK